MNKELEEMMAIGLKQKHRILELEERVKELEDKLATANNDLSECCQPGNEEPSYYKAFCEVLVENSYHADHTIYQGNCITCAEWEDTDRENTKLKAEIKETLGEK